MEFLFDRIASLSPAKRVLLEQRLGRLRTPSSRAASLRPRSVSQEPPLSYAQERLWFMHRLAPENPVYNFPCVLPMAGELNHSALRRSLEEIVRRHEGLRTTFPSKQGQPFQQILAAGPVP